MYIHGNQLLQMMTTTTMDNGWHTLNLSYNLKVYQSLTNLLQNLIKFPKTTNLLSQFAGATCKWEHAAALPLSCAQRWQWDDWCWLEWWAWISLGRDISGRAWISLKEGEKQCNQLWLQIIGWKAWRKKSICASEYLRIWATTKSQQNQEKSRMTH